MTPLSIVRVLAIALVCGSMPAARTIPIVLDHEAYVWQRKWSPQLGRAMDQGSEFLDGWRILFAEVGADGRIARAMVESSAVERSGRPVTAVIRIDGRLPNDVSSLSKHIREIYEDAARQVPLAGLEIDFDCPTSRLGQYADLLSAVRSDVPKTSALSLTVLPTWIGAPQLQAVLAQVDQATLQVHAISSPQFPLFESGQARDWVMRFASYRKDFRVSLPTYGARVSWRPDGKPLVESERSLLASTAPTEELASDPREIQAFVAALPSIAGPHLRGISWFRLPTDRDRLAWSLPTLKALVRGYYPNAIHPVIVVAPQPGGWSSIVLRNDSDLDTVLPKDVRLDGSCLSGDGVNGYIWTISRGQMLLRSARQMTMRPGSTRVIGWTRCHQVNLHAS